MVGFVGSVEDVSGKKEYQKSYGFAVRMLGLSLFTERSPTGSGDEKVSLSRLKKMMSKFCLI